MKLSHLYLSLTALLALNAANAQAPTKEEKKAPAKAAAAPLCHDHAVTPKGKIKNPVFISQDAKKKVVCVLIIATFDKSNYGMNFNGLSKSLGGYEIPLGWKVKVTFKNNSAVPHSVMVMEEELAARKINLGDTPYFDGATTPKANTVGTTSKVEKFEFTADEEGEYAFACGFPTHSANGHRIYLKIDKKFTKAAFVTPKKETPKKDATKKEKK